MTFEFILIHQPREDEPILGILRERLRESLEANLNDVEDDALWRMVQTTFERSRPAEGAKPARALLSFGVELPDETASLRTVIDEFADGLLAEPVVHVVKFEDPLLHRELAERSEDLFVLELKLRRVLSVIYLHAYDTEPYNLLREEKVTPQPENNPPKPADMQEVWENEFFHLTFRQYGALNQRPEVTKVPDLKKVMEQMGTYAALLAELDRKPVLHSDDAGFLAGLRDLTHAIEAMRNCVAHYRRPSQNLTTRYQSELTQLHEALDLFLERNRGEWEDSLDDGEWVWDTETRLAVERAMESAEWNDEEKTIELQDGYEPRRAKTAASRDELVSHLEDVAEEAFYAHCSRDDGDWVSECDANGVVEGVLADYEERLAEFFAPAEEDEEDDDEPAPPAPPAPPPPA